MLDEAKQMRPGEALDQDALSAHLALQFGATFEIREIRQFPGGYSNLTYLLVTSQGDFVLRRPPFGANIKSAHDMGREYRVLSLLHPVFGRVPRPVWYCEDPEVLGASFYLMERVQGVILRNRIPEDITLSPALMREISTAAIDNLAALHRLELYSTGLVTLGKPEGYIGRQVSGWIERYYKAETDTLPTMDELARWMPENQPDDGAPALIHNDYKYDNLVLDPNNLAHILAVLDWEMCTVGDPLMDLGVTLAYWLEGHEADLLSASVGNLTWLPGNLSRQELAGRYAAATGRDMRNLLFYYIFGIFKIGVIVQQIYARYKKGFTQDPRFAPLIEVVRTFGQRGCYALEKGYI
ncbi:MAG: phosphotransferase family protein [Saprospiraceae bacterium]|jgi:aminoglycoside phosphotransferase (APT) family kinase protein